MKPLQRGEVAVLCGVSAGILIPRLADFFKLSTLKEHDQCHSLTPMMHFFCTERPRLVADGIVDAPEQDRELERRWQAMQAIRATAKDTPETLALDDPLTESQLTELNLISQGVTRGPDGLKFIYALGDDPAEDALVVSDPTPPSRKRCREQDDASLTFKLLISLKKDTLQAVCEDLALPVSGNKESLARAVVAHALM